MTRDLDAAGRRLADLLGHPDAPDAWRRDAHNATTLVRFAADLLALCADRPQGRSVMDAGCGDGIPLLAMVALGVRHGLGFDVDARRIAIAEQGRATLPPELAERFEVRVGDVAALPAGDGEVDLLLSVEGVGVYLDVDAFLREAARAVRPGGTVLISELNNARNPRLRESTEDLWEVYERGPVPQTLHDHHITSTYVDRRAEIVREVLPAADDATVRRLAAATTGMVAQEIRDACAAVAAGGAEPTGEYARGTLPIAPDAMVVERPVDPVELAARLTELGFRAQARGYWGGAGGSPLVRAANRILAAGGRLTLTRAPSFRVVGVRT